MLAGVLDPPLSNKTWPKEIKYIADIFQGTFKKICLMSYKLLFYESQVIITNNLHKHKAF